MIRRIEVIERNGRTARKSTHQYAAITRYSSSSNHMIREPASAARVQVVVTDSVPTRGGVDKPMITGVDRDVADFTVLSKKHEISNFQ